MDRHDNGQEATAVLDSQPHIAEPVFIDDYPTFSSTWTAYAYPLLAALMLIPALPLIGFLTVLTQCTSAGSGLFRQMRVGRHGRPFTMYKIRTMVRDAECAMGAVWASQNDPRVTWLGAILRRSHLDELPQLFNIVLGQMSFVGPRPERPEFVDQLAEAIPGYFERLAVLPGITGLAQINLPPDQTLECVRKKLTLDLEYVRTQNFSLDARILLATLFKLFRVARFAALRVLQVDRYPVEDPHSGPAEIRGQERRATELRPDPGFCPSRPASASAVLDERNTARPVELFCGEALMELSSGTEI